jgi:hypothetical protein
MVLYHTTMSIVMSYNLLLIENINNDGFTLELPQSAVDMINKISDVVGATNYVKTPVFHKKAKNKGKNVIEEPYVPRPVVEKTKVEELKAVIQISLNKMTEKTYSTFEEKILIAVGELKTELNDDETFMNDVTYWVFNLALANRFSSKQYVNILIKLQDNYTEIKSVFDSKINEFLKYFDNIESINPDEDYEKFCLLKAEGEKRKALSMFLVNLYNSGLYSLVSLEEIIIKLIDEIYINYKKEDCKATCEDIVDNIYELVNTLTGDLKKGSSYSLFINKITNVKDLNKDENPSFSNKTKFRLMDILDSFKK